MKRIGMLGPLLTALLAAMAWLSLGPGCGGGGDDDDGGTEEDDDQADDDADDDDDVDTTPPDPPTVNDVPEATPLTEQTLTGWTEAGARVAVRGGAAGAVATADPDTGAFCVVVELVVNADNVLEVTATDAWRNQSEPTIVEIRQDPSLYPEADNRAPYGTATASSSSTTDCPECTPDKAIDGNAVTYWRNSTNPLNPDAFRSPQWLMVDLGEEVEVTRAVVRWGADYGTDYGLFYWTSPVPGTPPAPDEVLWEWTVVYTEGFGNGDEDDLELAAPTRAQFWALVLNKASRQNPVSHLYYYELHELEILGVPVSEIPTDPGCE